MKSSLGSASVGFTELGVAGYVTPLATATCAGSE